MKATPTLSSGVIGRSYPNQQPDSQNVDSPFRLFQDSSVAVTSVVRKTHVLADEGTYFLANNVQTAIAPTYGTSLVATSPYILIQNQSAFRLNLDYATLTAIVAGACTTAVGYTAISVVIDNILRYTSGGTSLTPLSPNMLVSPPAGVQVYCGAIVATAASASARTIVGIRNIRPGVSSTVVNVIGDCNVLNFGGVEAALNGNITVANSNLIPTPLPPAIIGPGQSALIYLWFPVMTAPSAATYAPEVGFWLR